MTHTSLGTLQHSFTKLSRARRHIAELEDEIKLYLEKTPPSALITEFKPPVGEEHLLHGKIRIEIPATPPEWSAIIGDAIHNIRTSLDLAACECVRKNGSSDKGVFFPFCETANELDKMIKQRNFHRAHPDIVAYVRSLAPHKGGNLALRAIHDLDIRDKHQAIIPHAVSIGSPVIEVLDEHHRPLIPPRIVGLNPTTDAKVVFPNDTPFSGEEIIPTLHKLVALADSIITALARIVETTRAT